LVGDDIQKSSQSAWETRSWLKSESKGNFEVTIKDAHYWPTLQLDCCSRHYFNHNEEEEQGRSRRWWRRIQSCRDSVGVNLVDIRILVAWMNDSSCVGMGIREERSGDAGTSGTHGDCGACGS